MQQRGGAAVAVLTVLVLAVAGLVGCAGGGTETGAGGGGVDFTGRCVGGTLLVEELFDPVDVIGLATDPLHVTVRVDPAVAPRPGDQVTVVTGELAPPGITAIVTALGPPSPEPTADGLPARVTVPVTIGVWPRDSLAQTFVPGVPARVTLQRNGIGKAETISVDSLRPVPPRLPGPSTIWVTGPGPGDEPLQGRAHPVAVTVGQIAQGRATFSTTDPTFGPYLVGTTWPIVVPDRHCDRNSEPGPGGTREWDTQSPGTPSPAFDQDTPLPDTAPPLGSPVPGADQTHQDWTHPVRELDLDDPLEPLDPTDPGAGVSVGPTGPDRLEVTLALRWLGARPVLAEDWVGPYYEPRFWEGGDTRRSALGCAPASGPIGHPCAARYTVAMPPAAVLRAHTITAPITVAGLSQGTFLSTGSGRVTLGGVSGDVSVLSTSGDVAGTVAGRVGTGLYEAGGITVKTGGRVDLHVSVPPRSLDVTGGNGPVTVELPRGPTYRIETDSFPSGRRQIDVPSDPNATHLVTVRADGTGDVTVRYAP